MQLQSDEIVQIVYDMPLHCTGALDDVPKKWQVCSWKGRKTFSKCYLCSIFDSPLDRGFSLTGMRSFSSHTHDLVSFCLVSPLPIERLSPPSPPPSFIWAFLCTTVCLRFLRDSWWLDNPHAWIWWETMEGKHCRAHGLFIEENNSRKKSPYEAGSICDVLHASID